MDISDENYTFKTDMSLFVMSISILPSEACMHMSQEVCKSNEIQILTRIFSNSLSLRGEISKMSASVGSCNESSEDYNLFRYPSVTTITNLESNYEGILGPEPVKKILLRVFS